MKKLLIPLLLFTTSLSAQYNDGKTNVQVTSPTTFTITNLQNCATDYTVYSLPAFSTFVTPVIQPGASTLIEVPTCSHSQVFTNTNCTTEPLPVGIEVSTCNVLADSKVQMFSRVKNGYIEGCVKFATPPDYKYYYFSIPMSDGTARKERVELKEKKGDWYIFKVKL